MPALRATWLPSLGQEDPLEKRMAAQRATWLPSLGREDPLEKRMAAHSGILTWRIPWTRGAGGLQSVGSQSQTRLSD